MKDYKKYVDPYTNNFIKVGLKEETVEKIDKLSYQIATKKLGEEHHKTDNSQEHKRFMTGLLGEAAVSNVLKKPIIDWSVGDSKQYNTADLSKLGIKVGIKTVEKGKFPVIFKNSYYPEIIVIKNTNKDLFVCGLATVDILKEYQDDELILSPLLRSRGVKTGFWGFEYLKPFKNFEELKGLL